MLLSDDPPFDGGDVLEYDVEGAALFLGDPGANRHEAGAPGNGKLVRGTGGRQCPPQANSGPGA